MKNSVFLVVVGDGLPFGTIRNGERWQVVVVSGCSGVRCVSNTTLGGRLTVRFVHREIVVVEYGMSYPSTTTCHSRGVRFTCTERTGMGLVEEVKGWCAVCLERKGRG